MAKQVGDLGMKALQKAAASSQALPHLSQLAEHFISVAGGPRKVAKMLFEEWTSARPGSIVRARVLDLIARVWRFASETTEGKEELGLLSEDDLHRELLRAALQAGVPVGVSEARDAATQEKAADPAGADAAAPAQGEARQEHAVPAATRTPPQATAAADPDPA